MNAFEKNRIEASYFKINELKYRVPYTVINPLHIDDNSKVIVFMNGLNGDRAWLKYFNHRIFDNNYLISFDQKGQAYNQEKPTQFYRRLINYNLKVLEHITQLPEYKNRDVILIGESWGANATLLMAKKRPDLMKGFLIWNMPGKLPSTNFEVPTRKRLVFTTKTLFTYFTGINTRDVIPFDTRLTTNKILIRASKYQNNSYSNNKISIAIFFSFRPAWRIIRNNNLQVPFVYVQSMNDIMFSKKKFSHIKNHKNVVTFEKGHHLLYLDDVSNLLGDEIEKFILSL
ncbi:MAG: serine aminopeptidase domain-containing protein [Metamycoplasmataceae bacterium]